MGLGWPAAYGLTALLVFPGAIASLWLGPGRHTAIADRKWGFSVATHFLKHNVVSPFSDLLRRPGALLILLFILTYKLGDALGQNMLSPMIVHQGFSDMDYITISKFVRFGFLALGSLLAGGLIARFGIARLLFGAGIIMVVVNLMFSIVASTGHSVAMLALSVAAENLFAAISLTVFVTYLSGLSNTAFTATQYALLSSFSAVGRTFATTPSGVVAEQLGFAGFYIFCAILGIPGLIVLWLMHRRGFIVEDPRQKGAQRTSPV
jgi:PAT family beta-lactamase induction signal transducer AmpG